MSKEELNNEFDVAVRVQKAFDEATKEKVVEPIPTIVCPDSGCQVDVLPSQLTILTTMLLESSIA